MSKNDPRTTIPERDITIDFIKSSGPGGQNVNKVATACQLRFNVRDTTYLSEDIKTRLERIAGTKMTRDGFLVLVAKRYRTQERNLSDAMSRLEDLIRKASIMPKLRKMTHPTAASQIKRIVSKKKRGEMKQLRKSPPD